MAYEISYVDNTGSEGVAHWQMLLRIKTLAEANGWTTLRYLNPTPYTDPTVMRELIMRGVGLSGDQAIYIGLRAYQSQTADVYNLSVAGFSGYVAGNSFVTQPGYIESGIPAHNNRIDYWLVANAQRIAFALKVGTPVYESGYVGYCLPFATPGQYPYPLVVGGMLVGVPVTRFSDATHAMPYNGARGSFRLRFVDGSWLQPSVHPWVDNTINNLSQLRDTGGTYALMTATMCSVNWTDKYGDLDGVFHITGFGNAVENTLTIDGANYVVVQDVGRTGFNNYYALRLD